MKRLIVFFSVVLSIILLIGCNEPSEDNINVIRRELSAERNRNQTLESTLVEYSELINDLRLEVKDKESIIEELHESHLKTGPVMGHSLLQEALTVIEVLQNQDVNVLNNYISPDRGVRFSPYTFVDEDNDVILNKGSEIFNMFGDDTVYLWGQFDGTGDPIEKTITDYYMRFVYDADFANPDIIGINQIISQGNTINNIPDVYPNDYFVEFHMVGTNPEFVGMDWRSLTLVFENVDGLWYLVGVVHNEWTI